MNLFKEKRPIYQKSAPSSRAEESESDVEQIARRPERMTEQINEAKSLLEGILKKYPRAQKDSELIEFREKIEEAAKRLERMKKRETGLLEMTRIYRLNEAFVRLIDEIIVHKYNPKYYTPEKIASRNATYEAEVKMNDAFRQVMDENQKSVRHCINTAENYLNDPGNGFNKQIREGTTISRIFDNIQYTAIYINGRWNVKTPHRG